MEAVLERITGERRAVVGSGRTDRGVHALGQVASVDVPANWSAVELRRSMNALLPIEVWLKEVRRVPADFHPRFHPVSRTYEYRIGAAQVAGSPFHRRWCWDASDNPPELALLSACAERIPGDRCFGSFAKAGQPERGTRSVVQAASWAPWGEIGYRFEIRANRYLHRMVRYLVGTMVDVARGRRSIDELDTLLHDPDAPIDTSPPAPPEGLFLARVEYPPDRWGEHPDHDPSIPHTPSR